MCVMAKRFLMIILTFLCIISPWPAWGTLFYYSGTMDAEFEMTHTITIELFDDRITELRHTFSLPEDYTLPTNTQDATEAAFTYSVTPTEEDLTDDFGNHYTRLTWTNPSPGTITITITYTVTAGTDWDGFVTGDPFPVNTSGLPGSVTPFLEATDEVQSNNSTLISHSTALTSGITTQWEAVLAICGWVMDNIDYDSNENGTDAISTYNDRVGVCTNFSQLACALLRAAGIPARYASGHSLYKQYTLPSGPTTYWGQGPHAWIEVYYPSLGWVPYDPQRDIHHIDTRRVLTGIGRDTTEGAGEWIWFYDTSPSTYPIVSSTISVTWIADDIDLSYIKQTDEITKSSLSTDVTFTNSYPSKAMPWLPLLLDED
jgi:transglutaminase-like putative cysteine protease